jgi:hypothetical protein
MRYIRVRVERKKQYNPHPGHGESRQSRKRAGNNGLFIMCAPPNGEGGWSERDSTLSTHLRCPAMFILLYGGQPAEQSEVNIVIEWAAAA